MSQKIPFLEMFAALRQWTELSNGVEGWLIVSAAIDKGSRSAKILVERAEGAGPNLIAQAEEAVCRAYGLGSVKIEAAAPADNSVSQTGAQRSGSGLERTSKGARGAFAKGGSGTGSVSMIRDRPEPRLRTVSYIKLALG